MILLAPFEVDHARSILPLHQGETLRQVEQQLIEPGPYAFTLIEDALPVAAGGVAPVMPEVGEAWVMVSESLKDKLHFHYQAKRLQRLAIESMGLRRLQACVPSDVPLAKRWASLMGLEYEGTMKKYAPGGIDVDRYAWVRD